MIGIIAAMDIEAEGLIALLENTCAEQVLGITYTMGVYAGKNVVVAVSGIGKVNAGMCTALMLHKYEPEIILSIGVAGSISPEMKLLDICVASFVCQHDFDTAAFGDPLGLLPGHKEVQMPCDKRLVSALSDAASAYGNTVVAGMVCGDQFVASKEKKLALHEQFGAFACEMESGAIGQVAFQNSIPFAVVRVISDSLTDDAHMEYETFKLEAAKRTIRVVCDTIKKL